MLPRHYLRWAFWTLAYLCRPKPRDLMGYLTYGHRTRRPWWKFKPCAWHNDDGKQWHVYFRNDADYTERRLLQVEAHVAFDTGEIVGLTIWDETLAAKKESA